MLGGTYGLRPHRFGLDVAYFRDRFRGADTQAVGFRGIGWTGQKTDSVWLNASWSGQLGPVKALLQGNLVTGTARGGTAGLRTAAPANNPYAIGADVVAGGGQSTRTGALTECAHASIANPFNSRLGERSHVGLFTAYSNPGTLVIPVGLKVFPLKEHELVGWYVYRAMVDSTLLEVALAPELAGRRLSKSIYHEIGGFWRWAPNPHLDIRLTGMIGIPGEGYKDLARLADCNPNVPGVQACAGNDLALKAEARFRARF